METFIIDLNTRNGIDVVRYGGTIGKYTNLNIGDRIEMSKAIINYACIDDKNNRFIFYHYSNLESNILDYLRYAIIQIKNANSEKEVLNIILKCTPLNPYIGHYIKNDNEDINKDGWLQYNANPTEFYYNVPLNQGRQDFLFNRIIYSDLDSDGNIIVRAYSILEYVLAGYGYNKGTNNTASVKIRTKYEPIIDVLNYFNPLYIPTITKCNLIKYK